jgi:hypothetical protein
MRIITIIVATFGAGLASANKAIAPTNHKTAVCQSGLFMLALRFLIEMIVDIHLAPTDIAFHLLILNCKKQNPANECSAKNKPH